MHHSRLRSRGGRITLLQRIRILIIVGQRLALDGHDNTEGGQNQPRQVSESTHSFDRVCVSGNAVSVLSSKSQGGKGQEGSSTPAECNKSMRGLVPGEEQQDREEEEPDSAESGSPFLTTAGHIRGKSEQRASQAKAEEGDHNGQDQEKGGSSHDGTVFPRVCVRVRVSFSLQVPFSHRRLRFISMAE